MWDINFRKGNVYNVTTDSFYEFFDGLSKNYLKFTFTIMKSDGKFHIFHENMVETKGKFKIVRYIKEKFDWKHPFRHREVSEILFECISEKENG